MLMKSINLQKDTYLHVIFESRNFFFWHKFT
jgi:hypothetical protein